MERVMSVEDKIRKAEERYYRKREMDVPARESVRNRGKEKKNIKLLNKMIKQIFICLLIYGTFYLVVNNNYIFSEDFTNKAKEILSQDINFAEIYSTVSNQIKVFLEKENSNQEEINQDDMVQEEEKNEDIQNNDENIGGAVEELTNQEQNVENNSIDSSSEQVGDTENSGESEVQLSQMEQDANFIKSTINFIKPVEGRISSAFGLRNPTTPTVPKNHTGTDIAANTGTKIVAATDGTVILASSQGDYGNHLKIQINDVVIVYAHCNKLYVKEGDSIKQGQEIAEVGSTGNTTGPHLHFEVRYQERYVDPQMILEL